MNKYESKKGAFDIVEGQIFCSKMTGMIYLVCVELYPTSNGEKKFMVFARYGNKKNDRVPFFPNYSHLVHIGYL